MAQNWSWVKRVAIAAVAIGLVLRFANLDRKVYWHDEVYTSLRVAGYVGPAVAAAVSDRPDLTAADLLRYQQMPPAPSLTDCWDSLSANPEHPPLYYLLAHGWGRLFGASVGGYRAIAAVFGAIALPVMFWLARQLFPLPSPIPWVATALLALSPVQLIYSQEAREYTLWIVGLLLAHGTLVRALQQKTAWAWVAYGWAMGLTWYGSLMTVLLGLSHLVFVALSQRSRRSWLGFGLAHGLGLGLFLPWIVTIVSQWGRLQAVTAWTREPRPLGFLAQLWGLHYSAAVVDFNLPLDHPFTVAGPTLVLGLGAVGLGYLWRNYPRSTVLFLACGLLVPPLVLIGSDIVRAGQLSRNTRYFLPSLVLMPLAIAPLITHGLTSPQRWMKGVGATLLALLLALGLASGMVNNRASTWWSKAFSSSNHSIAAYLNQVEAPVLMLEETGIALGEAISLSHYLRPETTIWLLPDRSLPTSTQLQAAYPQGTLILLRPTPTLLETVPPGWQTAPATDATQFAPTDLVRLTPPG
ncbi:glycosyltransferase family 39 protein [Nodosilinea sp. E11]|uniref:glycosyltransferase family 39 protein n=1 Tax=Nodosilinea sp. E11 TaxID=3037479 RepID=UPI002934150D|nr:glycosyltransferase family 39 protein [Nodosilinea sp. E11]WOD40650.1 glycosyltransferase family 39 protein [Nodosilinea sp. E11]